MPACIMYLIRHGATQNNLADPPRLQGRGVNLGLSERGLRQAERTAKFLAPCGLTAAYSSPLRRSEETAQMIAASCALPVQLVEEISEVDVGRWEGRSWEQIERSEPEAYRRFVDDPAVHGYAGGENLRQVQERVVPALERLLAANPQGRILVVGHNVVNRAFIAHLLALPIKHARSLSQDNCGVNCIGYQNGQMKLRTLNTVFHLE